MFLSGFIHQSDASHSGFQNKKAGFRCGDSGLPSDAGLLAHPALTSLSRTYIFHFPSFPLPPGFP